MSYWLAQACRQIREEAGVHQIDIAALVRKPIPGGGTKPSAISSVYRFEIGTGWPRNADEYVNAYAKTAGLADPRLVWDRALALWRKHGENPLAGTGSLSGFEKAIGEAAAAVEREAPSARGRKSA
jgi:hypothetical protein